VIGIKGLPPVRNLIGPVLNEGVLVVAGSPAFVIGGGIKVASSETAHEIMECWAVSDLMVDHWYKAVESGDARLIVVPAEAAIATKTAMTRMSQQAQVEAQAATAREGGLSTAIETMTREILKSGLIAAGRR